MIDNEPGQLELWRELRTEPATVVEEELEKVILERGPLMEVIIDNGTVFRSDILPKQFEKWNIRKY